MHLPIPGRARLALAPALLLAVVLSLGAPVPVAAASTGATTTAVVTSGSPSGYGQEVTLTATVTTTDGGAPTGTLTFDVDGQPIAAPVAVGSAGAGKAMLTTARWSVGTRSVTAVYSGDASYAASTSPAVTQQIAVDPTTVSLGASADPTYEASPVTLTARVVPANPIAGFSFSSDVGDVIGAGQSGTYGNDAYYWQNINPNNASLQITTPGDSWAVSIGMPPGYQSFEVGTYTGVTRDGTWSTTPLLNVTRNGNQCGTVTGSFTVTNVDADASGRVYGVDATFEQHCEGAAPAIRGTIHMSGLGNPSGFVTFFDGSTQLGTTGVYDHDSATLDVSSLSVGPHTLTASYAGNPAYAPGESAALSHQVDPRPPQSPTVADLTTSSNPAVPNQHVTLLAAVSTPADGSIPTGTVTYRDGGTVLGTAEVDQDGLAAMSTVFVLGEHQLTATYGGDLTHGATTSGTLDQRVMIASQNRRFVNQLYNDILSRPADGGAATWATALDNGTVDRTHVALALTTSTEYISDEVQASYLAHLGRQADPNGLAYWVGYIQHGATVEDLEISFLGTPEYYTNAGGTPDTFLTTLYQDVFGRDIDPGGRTYWDNRLASGTPAWQVAASVVKSTEAMSNRVTSYYWLLLGRAPDTTGLNSWVSLLQHGTRDETLLARLAGSTEYWNDTQAY